MIPSVAETQRPTGEVLRVWLERYQKIAAGYRARPWLRPVVSVVIVVSFVLIVWFSPIVTWWPVLMEWIDGLGPWGYVVFILLQAAATVGLVPTLLLGIGAGFVYGFWVGMLLLSIGATLGGFASFFISRALGREWVAHLVARNPKYAAIDDAVGREGWKIVLLTRLSPGLPFTVLNYFFGITKVSFASFATASYAGMIPRFIMYAYAGSVANGLTLADAVPMYARVVMPLTGLIVTIVGTALVAKLIRAAIEGDGGLEPLLDPDDEADIPPVQAIQPAEAVE